MLEGGIMANFGHVKTYTTIMNGGEITFRSLLEYRYAVYLTLLREQGHILEWTYEDEELSIEFQHGRYGNTRKYIPDFGVLNEDGEWEVHETKGYFPPIDATKIRAYREMAGNPFVLIFAKKPYGAQKRRAERIEKHVTRVIWNADKELFKPIKHLFEV